MTVAPHSMPSTSLQSALSQQPLFLAQWLSVIHGMLPLSQLTILGAGSGYSAVLSWAAEQAIESVSLVEANHQQFNQLSARWQATQPDWQLHNKVMEARASKADTFYVASNPAESGLLPPDALMALWPNIAEKESQPCEPVTIAAWAKEHWQSPGQWLFINYFCDAALLNQNKAKLAQVDVLMVRVSTEKALPESVTASAWEAALQQAGYRVVSRECERHPLIERWLCIKRLNREASTVKEDLTQTQAELAQVKEKLESTHTWFMNRKQQALEYEKQVATLESTLKATQEELAQTRKQAAQLKLLRESFDQLAQQITEGLTVQSEQRQQATNALGKHITQMLQPSQAQPPKEEKDNL